MSPKSNTSSANATAKTPKLQRGGKRIGAGRPKGSGKFKQPTKAMRVPISAVADIERYLAHYHSGATKKVSLNQTSADMRQTLKVIGSVSSIPSSPAQFPLHSSKVAAGVPSPADDHVDDTLDLNQYLVDHPDSTFMLKVEGESMIDAGILANDILIVDRSVAAKHNKIVIASINGQLTVKRLYHRDGLIKLIPENKDYPIIEFENETDLHIWGVVIGSFRKI